MGIFDRLKNIKKQETEESSAKHIYTIPTLDGKEEITAFRPERVNMIKHSNGELTQLIISRIIKQREGDTIYFDYADYMAFELSKNQEITDEIMSAAMRQYEREYGSIEHEQQCYYIGKAIDDKNGWYVFGDKSFTVQIIVDRIVQKQILERNSNIQKRLEDKKQEREIRERELRASIGVTEYLEAKQKEKEERIKNPEIKEVLYYHNEQRGKKFDNYDGININTGDILRIRQIDKVGKDGSGTYLYSAYVKNTENESDVEFFIGNEPDGYAVCFELQKRLEDTVKRGNVQEITQVLALLSDERNFKDKDHLNYIGGIDKNGQVYRKEKSESNSIQAKIEGMKQDFDRRRTQQKNNGMQK